MIPKPRIEKQGGAAAVLAVGLLIGPPVFYVLSIGPVAHIAQAVRIGDELMEVLTIPYAPIAWAAE